MSLPTYLYFISDLPAAKGQWAYDEILKYLYLETKDNTDPTKRRVFATDDPTMGYTYPIDKNFVEKYAKESNNGYDIEFVMIEFEPVPDIIMESQKDSLHIFTWYQDKPYKVLLNADGGVKTMRVQSAFLRPQVEELLQQYGQYILDNARLHDVGGKLKQNHARDWLHLVT